ncbi:DUF1573 domain-containing protein, partial [Xanthovirga aplysinae]|uniref:DUF1573 domain-containing protein n=1 Tax=Xanthovirga aplysinae TaxID=2529853 RepID=UPI0012BD35BE
MKRTLSFLLLLVGLYYTAKGQKKPSINFETASFDFGVIRESEGGKSHRFEFKVLKNKKVYLSKVEASCGCTTPSWSTDTLSSGEKGFVEIYYDPTNRAGNFKKNVEVFTSVDEKPFVLTISGKVVPGMEDLEREFPVKIGDLRLKENRLSFGQVSLNDAVIRKLEVYNEGNQILIFDDTISGPSYVGYKYYPQTLRPHEKGVIQLVFQPKTKKELGYKKDVLRFYTDEENNRTKEISVFAFIRPYFPPQTKKMLAHAPKIALDKISQDLGKLEEGEKAKGSFEILNKGKTKLEIQKITTNCDCLKINQVEKKLKPGHSKEVNFVF